VALERTEGERSRGRGAKLVLVFSQRATDRDAQRRLAEEAESMELARLAAAGSLRARQLLLEQLAPTVARVASAVLGPSNPDFDDVVQQSLIAVLGALPGFRGECQPAGFASSIAFRVALKHRRRQQTDRLRRDYLAQLGPVETNTLDLHDPCQRRRLIRDLLVRLPEPQAEALALRVVLGLSLEEVAQTTGVPLNTVRSRVRLAKEALRRRITTLPALRDALEGGT
jgi:RNA polymerase sigma factor (sigma-70 family)